MKIKKSTSESAKIQNWKLNLNFSTINKVISNESLINKKIKIRYEKKVMTFWSTGRPRNI